MNFYSKQTYINNDDLLILFNEVNYMVNNYDTYAPRVDRMLNDNGLIHLITPELRKAILEKQNEAKKKDTEKEPM